MNIRFEFQIRYTKRVSMFPVGFMSDLFVSSPILDKRGRFHGFYEGWIGNRTYPVDMAGFAVSIKHFIKVTKKHIFCIL